LIELGDGGRVRCGDWLWYLNRRRRRRRSVGYKASKVKACHLFPVGRKRAHWIQRS